MVLNIELLHQLLKSKNMKTSTDSYELHVERRIVLKLVQSYKGEVPTVVYLALGLGFRQIQRFKHPLK